MRIAGTNSSPVIMSQKFSLKSKSKRLFFYFSTIKARLL